MTVYDAIKSMSRESMARFLSRIDITGKVTDAVCGKKCPKRAQCDREYCAYIPFDKVVTYLDFLGMDADYALPRAARREGEPWHE